MNNENLFTMDDICDMYHFLIFHLEGKEIDELDCSDRYLLKDTIEAFLNRGEEDND